MFKRLGLFLALVAVLFLAVPVVDAIPEDGCKAKQEQKNKCEKCDKIKCDKCEKGKKCEDCAKKCGCKSKGRHKKGK